MRPLLSLVLTRLGIETEPSRTIWNGYQAGPEEDPLNCTEKKQEKNKDESHCGSAVIGLV